MITGREMPKMKEKSNKIKKDHSSQRPFSYADQDNCAVPKLKIENDHPILNLLSQISYFHIDSTIPKNSVTVTRPTDKEGVLLARQEIPKLKEKNDKIKNDYSSQRPFLYTDQDNCVVPELRYFRKPVFVTDPMRPMICLTANRATIKDDDGVFYLYRKIYDMPNGSVPVLGLPPGCEGSFPLLEDDQIPYEPSERVELPNNYADAVQIINKYMRGRPMFEVIDVKRKLKRLMELKGMPISYEGESWKKLWPLPGEQRWRGKKHEKASVWNKATENERLECEVLEHLLSGDYSRVLDYPPEIVAKFDNLNGGGEWQSEGH